MIDIQQLKYRYPSGEAVLDGVDLAVSGGEYVLLCGANGSGKSTLAYTVNGLVPHHFGGAIEGSVRVVGLDVASTPPAELFDHAGLVLQNTDAQLFNATVEDELAFGPESLGRDPQEIMARIRDTAAELEISHLLPRAPSELSGGERRLVSIAAVLSGGPPLMVLDEPFANLDWVATGKLRRTLSRIHQRGTTLMIVEQILDGFSADVSRCVVMDQGRVAMDGPMEALRPALVESKLIPRYSPPFRPAGVGQPLLTVEGLEAVMGGRKILHGASLEIRQGETVALVGSNGSGKTTFVKHLNGLLKPAAGKVLYRGKNVCESTPSQMATLVGLSFQNPNNQFFTTTVEEELLAGPRAVGTPRSERFDEMIDLFRLEGFMDRSPYRLSEGEKKRVAICSILAMEPEMLVLDEPTAGQDGRSREALALTLNKLTEEGLTTLVVTHDLEFAGAVAPRWVLLKDGQIKADGPAAEVARAGGLPWPAGHNGSGGGDEQP